MPDQDNVSKCGSVSYISNPELQQDHVLRRTFNSLNCCCVWTLQNKIQSSWRRWPTSWRGSRCLRATPTCWPAERSPRSSSAPKMLPRWTEAPSTPWVSPGPHTGPRDLHPVPPRGGKTLSPVPPPGCTGLEELLGIEPAFQEFQDTLFSRASLTLERSVQSKEVNEKLDAGVSLFLTRLCPYLLLKPAHKCIEWLVHRYDVPTAHFTRILLEVWSCGVTVETRQSSGLHSAAYRTLRHLDIIIIIIILLLLLLLILYYYFILLFF